jgi:hypothetical protein
MKMLVTWEIDIDTSEEDHSLAVMQTVEAFVEEYPTVRECTYIHHKVTED